MAGSQDSIYTHTQVDMHDDSSMRRRPGADADEVRRVTRFETARAPRRAGHLLAGVGVRRAVAGLREVRPDLTGYPFGVVVERHAVSRPDDGGA